MSGGGGGSGGGGPVTSEEEKALYGIQAEIAREQWDEYKRLGLPIQENAGCGVIQAYICKRICHQRRAGRGRR